MRIERVEQAAAVEAGGELFDHLPTGEATADFLAQPGHHLLFAYADAEDGDPDDGDQGRPLGFVSGVETTHPDKGTELFLYELSVDERVRGRGVATALVRALADLARARGCYGMWVLTEPDNAAAIATYRKAGGTQEDEPSVLLEWDLAAPPSPER